MKKFIWAIALFSIFAISISSCDKNEQSKAKTEKNLIII
jgi:uncharacterized lipoprotein YehR (DUF1307 family)